MAVYTMLDKRELADIIEDYALVKLISANGISTGSVNTNYLLETARGKHLVRVDEVKSELEVKRELDLLPLPAQARLSLPAAGRRPQGPPLP